MDEQVNQEEFRQNTDSAVLSRSAQLLRAASPYLDTASQQLLGTFVHMQDFMDTIQAIKRNGLSLPFLNRTAKSDTIFMAGLNNNSSMDTEGLLKSIRPFCTKKEGGIIDQIMNIFQMKRMFSMYQTMSNMMSMMNMANGANPMPNSDVDFSQAMNMAAMMSQMMNSSQFSPNNQNSTKNSSPNATNTNYKDPSASPDNTNETYHTYTNIPGNDSRTNQETRINHQSLDDTSNDNLNNEYLNNEYLDNEYLDNEYLNNAFQNSHYEYKGPNQNNQSQNNQSQNNAQIDDSIDNDNNHSNTNSTTNSQMLEMLSSMIPAEQKGTFEAMKLLMESGLLK